MLGALGVVYGDIGTSPLYTVKQCFEALGGVTPGAVYGVLSLITWALIAVVTLKYVCVIMRADNRGEGGILALTALALRVPRAGTKLHWWILAAGLLGAALFYGDGVITPAISVLSAVEGLKVATPLFDPYVIPLTIGRAAGPVPDAAPRHRARRRFLRPGHAAVVRRHRPARRDRDCPPARHSPRAQSVLRVAAC